MRESLRIAFSISERRSSTCYNTEGQGDMGVRKSGNVPATLSWGFI